MFSKTSVDITWKYIVVVSKHVGEGSRSTHSKVHDTDSNTKEGCWSSPIIASEIICYDVATEWWCYVSCVVSSLYVCSTIIADTSI